MTLSAQPSRNGNSEDDFRDAYMQLAAAKDAVDVAASKLLADVANGRNYQHLDNPDEHIIRDRHRIQGEAQKIAGMLGTLQSDLVEILT